MDIDKLKEAAREKYTNKEGLVNIGKYDHHLLDEIVTSTYLQAVEAEGVLSKFSYEDWEVGDDDKLRVGDYINLNHQRGYDGYEQNLQGKIVLHHVNQMPVILYNIEPETEDEEESGDYGDLQSFFMDGWTFSRLQSLKQTKEHD